ncbi:MAG: endonuclease/exonuclease/phosphatase family protein [Planctomycetes bacterium]|nr:endonuclease/exonuclease/phosphatase family protein [Planctomycetota bacterium]
MRARLRGVLGLLALLAAPIAIAPWCARWHWSLDLLANFVVQAGWFLLLAAALFAWQRAWRALSACLAGAAVAGAAVLPDWFGATATVTAAPAASVRLLALNLLRDNEANAALALAGLADAAPDIVLASELTPEWHERLAPGLAAFPHRHVRTDPGYFGVGLWSRWPLRDATIVSLGWSPAIRAVVDTPYGPIGVLGVHTPRPGNAARNADRDQALAAIPKAVQGLPAAHVVLGDCNATPWTPTLRDLVADGSLRAATFGSWLPSWPTMWPLPLRIPIDHALLGPGLDALEVGTGPSFGSDHLPLFAVVQPRR